MTARALFGWGIVMLLASATLGAQRAKEDGDRLQRKIDEVARNGSTLPVRSKQTRATENELNSYLAFNARDRIPRALTQPQVTLIGDGRLAGQIFVDLDEFKRQRGSDGFLDPLNYISGMVPVTARGVLRTREGRGQFQLDSAEIRGIPLPKPLLQEMVSFFTRTPERPEGFDIDAPFALPAKIREVAIGKGETVVVQ